MTSAQGNNTEFRAPEIVNTIHQRSLGVGIIFGVAALIAAILPATREQFFHSYLLGLMLWLGVTLGSMAILMINLMTGGAWGMVIRRQLEAAVRLCPSSRCFLFRSFSGCHRSIPETTKRLADGRDGFITTGRTHT